RPGDFGGRVEVDVADQAAFAFVVGGQSVDADVDHGRAGFEPVSLDHLGPAYCGNDDIGAPHDPGQIAGLAVRDRDGAALLEEEQRHRLADDVGTADHHRFLAGEIAELTL